MRYKMYDGRTVEVTKRLKHCPNGQCGVIVDEHNAVHLISYCTPVITIDSHGWLTCNGTYSATTRKHIGAFLKEYASAITYHMAKHCYEHNKTINVHTLEIADLA